MFFFETGTLGDYDPIFTIEPSGPNVWTAGATATNPTIYGPNPTYGGGGSGVNWNNIWNNIFGVGSQAIAAWGNNPTQQVGNYGTVGIGQGYSPAAIGQSYAQIAAANAQQQAMYGSGRPQSQANSLDGIFGSLTNTISNNPLIFAGAAVGLYLLFRQPPGRR